MSPAIPQQQREQQAWTWGRILRWASVALSVTIVFLMLKRPQPVADPVTPEQSAAELHSFQQKIASLQAPPGEGTPVRLSSAEISAVLAEQFASAASGVSVRGGPVEVLKPAVQLTADRMQMQFGVKKLGQDIWVTLGGQVAARNGELQLDFSDAHIGSMPVPVSLMNSLMRSKIAKGQLRLPANIQDIKIENGELVITPRQ